MSAASTTMQRSVGPHPYVCRDAVHFNGLYCSLARCFERCAYSAAALRPNRKVVEINGQIAFGRRRCIRSKYVANGFAADRAKSISTLATCIISPGSSSFCSSRNAFQIVVHLGFSTSLTTWLPTAFYNTASILKDHGGETCYIRSLGVAREGSRS